MTGNELTLAPGTPGTASTPGTILTPGMVGTAATPGTALVPVTPETPETVLTSGVRLIAAPHPFSVARIDRLAPEGLTLAVMVELAQPDPLLAAFAHVYVGDHYVPRENWHLVRPRAGAVVTLRAVPQGGGKKNILGILLSIAVIAASFVFAQPLGAAIIGADGSFLGLSAGQLGSFIINTVGKLLISAIAPPPRPKTARLSNTSGRDSPTLFISGARNQARPFGPVPRVLGKHRMVPPLGARPFTEIEGNDQFLTVLYIWGYGPLEIEDIKIGETALDAFEGVTEETRQGFPDDDALTLITEDVFEETLSVLLTQASLSQNFTSGAVDPAGDKIDINDHGFSNGDTLVLTTTGTAPAGLTAGAEYYVVGATQDDVQLTTSIGGAAIGLTDGGSGTHSLADRGWQVRTSQLDTDDFSVDLTFPQGLVEFNDQGKKLSRTVTVELQFAPTGTQVWEAGNVPKVFGSARLSPSLPAPRMFLPRSGDGAPSERIDRVVLNKFTGAVELIKGKATRKLGTAQAPSRSSNDIPIARVLRKDDEATIPVEAVTDERGANPLFGDPANAFVPTASGDKISVAPGTLTFETITVTGKRSSAIRESRRVTKLTRAQYDVRLRRVTANTNDSQIFDKVSWTALRSFTKEDPIKMPGLAMTALRIKATDQLNGVVDTLNGVVYSIALDRVGGAWKVGATSNPAALFREVLQGSANARPLADSRIDLAGLEAWYDKAAAEGREFNMVIDFQSSVLETLADIAAAGRASPAVRDGKWGVVIDEPLSVPVQHFTPRNSSGFSGEKTFPDTPHAFRVRFVNRDKDWRQDEMVVYDDGFDATNAAKFEGLDLPGITDPDQVWKDARFHIAVARLRPEVFSFDTDIEHLVCTRGDLIRFTHDVPLFGLAAGRVKSVAVDGMGDATQVTLDELVSMEAGKSYSLRYRKADGSTQVHVLDTDPGENATLTFTTPVPAANIPATSDLAMFGETGQESVELVVQGIEPGPDLSARIKCLAAAPKVHDSGVLPGVIESVDTGAETITITGHGFFDGDKLRFSTTGVLPGGLAALTDYWVIGRTDNTFQVSATVGGGAVDLTSAGTPTNTATRQIADFVSNVTPLPAVGVPAVDTLRSDETVLARDPDGSLSARILVTLIKPVDLSDAVAQIEARYRDQTSAGPFDYAVQDVDAGDIVLERVEEGDTYEIALRYVTQTGRKGAYSTVQNHTVIGKSSPPADVTGFSAQQNGAAVNFRWSQVPDPDLGGYIIKQAARGAFVWADAEVVTNKTRGTAITTAQVQPGDKTFGIKALDTSTPPNESLIAAIFDVVVASTFDIIINPEQAPRWPGTQVNFVRHHSGVLVPTSQNLASDDGWETFDEFVPNPVSRSTYEAAELDVGFDDTVRVHADIGAALGPGESGNVTANLEIDFRTASGAYDGFESWSIGNVTARFVKARIVLDNVAGNVNRVTSFQPTADIDERIIGDEDVTVDVGGTPIAFNPAFHIKPRIVVTADGTAARTAMKSVVTTSGFTIQVFDATGTDVGGTVDWEATGA